MQAMMRQTPMLLGVASVLAAAVLARFLPLPLQLLTAASQLSAAAAAPGSALASGDFYDVPPCALGRADGSLWPPVELTPETWADALDGRCHVLVLLAMGVGEGDR